MITGQRGGVENLGRAWNGEGEAGRVRLGGGNGEGGSGKGEMGRGQKEGGDWEGCKVEREKKGQEERGFSHMDMMKCMGGHMECLGGMRLHFFLTLFTCATPVPQLVSEYIPYIGQCIVLVPDRMIVKHSDFNIF